MTPAEATALLERYDIPDHICVREDGALVIDSRLNSIHAAGIDAKRFLAFVEDSLYEERDDSDGVLHEHIDWKAVANMMAAEAAPKLGA